MTRRLLLTAVLVALSTAACTPARMAVPDHLASSAEVLPLTGMGGGKHGRFQLAGVPGTFSRGADRLGVMDPLLVHHSGGARFQLAASNLAPEIAGRCSYREGQINAGAISITPKRLGYRCDLTDGNGRLAGMLTIRDSHGAFGNLSGKAEREGVIDYKGERLVVRSVHQAAGAILPLQTPIGYMFLADGRQVGAIDLNGTDRTILAPRAGPLREAVIAASLALSVFWDPADVQSDY